MDYPNTGVLFTTKEKRHPQAPDMFGDIKFDRSYLLDMAEASDGDAVVIKIGGWLKKDKNGNRMVSIKVDNYNAPAKSAAKDPWDD